MAIPTSEDRIGEEPQCLGEGKCNAIGKIHRNVVSLELRGISHRDGQSQPVLPDTSQQLREANFGRAAASFGCGRNSQRASICRTDFQLTVSLARQVDETVLNRASRRGCNQPGHGLETRGYSLPITSRMTMMSATTPNAPLGP